jgi:hypothetical protein
MASVVIKPRTAPELFFLARVGQDSGYPVIRARSRHLLILVNATRNLVSRPWAIAEICKHLQHEIDDAQTAGYRG